MKQRRQINRRARPAEGNGLLFRHSSRTRGDAAALRLAGELELWPFISEKETLCALAFIPGITSTQDKMALLVWVVGSEPNLWENAEPQLLITTVWLCQHLPLCTGTFLWCHCLQSPGKDHFLVVYPSIKMQKICLAVETGVRRAWKAHQCSMRVNALMAPPRRCDFLNKWFKEMGFFLLKRKKEGKNVGWRLIWKLNL